MSAVLPDPRSAFAVEFNVPRGTMAKLDMYVAMLTDWQSRMNLVGRSTLPLVWDRHIRDSAQLMNLAPGTGYTSPWLDIGAGAGFPGLVLAAMAGVEVHLVESVGKKAQFLSAVADSLDLAETVRVEHCRIEALRRFEASVITARACASLAQLFDWGLGFSTNATTWLLPKGASVAVELAEAKLHFSFDYSLAKSLTDVNGRIVVARGVKRR